MPDEVINETVETQETQEPNNPEENAVQEAQPASSTETPPSSAENTKEYNWERARQRIEELEKRNKWLEERDQKNSGPPKPSEEDALKKLEEEISRLPKDDLLTVEQAEKLAHYRDKKSELRIQDLEKRLNETTQDSVEEKIMRQYPDYFSIASPENLKQLQSDPLFVKSLKGLESSYDQASYIYEQLKLRGFGSQEGIEKRQLENNAAKPRSSNSLGGTSPLHMANDYSGWPNKELKSKLFQEMQDAIKGA